MDQGGAAVDKTGVNLDQRGTRFFLGESILGGKNAARSDDGDGGAEFVVEFGDDLGGEIFEGFAGEAASFAGEGMLGDGVAFDGGVGGDEEVEPSVAKEAGEVGDLGVLEIGGDFQCKRDIATGFGEVLGLEFFESFEEDFGGVGRLEVAESGGVWGGKIGGDVVGPRAGFLESEGVVVEGVFVGGDLIFPDIDSDDAFERVG